MNGPRPGKQSPRPRVSSRTLAYLTLWLLLIVLIVARRVPPAEVTVVRGESEPFRLDINSASWEQWTLLDGIGETLARRIVTARDAQGGFESLEQVKAVPGVPDRPIDEARSWLLVGGTDGVPAAKEEMEDRARWGASN